MVDTKESMNTHQLDKTAQLVRLKAFQAFIEKFHVPDSWFDDDHDLGRINYDAGVTVGDLRKVVMLIPIDTTPTEPTINHESDGLE